MTRQLQAKCHHIPQSVCPEASSLHTKISDMSLLLIPLLIDHEVLSLISLRTSTTISLCSIESKCIHPTKKTTSALSTHHTKRSQIMRILTYSP
jgi:hypothetical protein